MGPTLCVIVATHGAERWRALGLAAAHDTRRIAGPGQSVLGWHQPDGDLCDTRNHAASLVTADWLCFLDADDRLDDSYLEAMRSAIRHDSSDPFRLLYPAVDYGDGARLLPARESLWHGNWLPIGTLIHRTVFRRCEGFWGERAWEDWSLWIRAAGLGARPVPVPDAVYRAARNHDGRNFTVTDPYKLGRSIRERNREWLIRQGQPDSVLARSLNAAEARHLERVE